MKALPASFFKKNRDNLLKELGKDAVVVMSGHTQLQMAYDVAYPFRQESNFYYLTGVEEPDWQIVISAQETYLVSPELSAVQKLFEGDSDLAAIKKTSGINSVETAEKGLTKLKKLVKPDSKVYTIKPFEQGHVALNPAIAANEEMLKVNLPGYEIHDATFALSKLRAIKQAQEIEVIQDAIDVTCEAFAAAHELKPKTEKEIEAEMSYTINKAGMKHGYEPIVAAGKNGLTVHYIDNTDKVEDGELVLIDVGAVHSNYSADITRTYSYGKTSKRQDEVKESVKKVQDYAISILKPGLKFSDYHSKVDKVMKEELVKLKLLKDEKDQDYRKYFPYAVSHGLGLDVHDQHFYDPNFPFDAFKEGMLLTVEPGIHIEEEGIAVRIEDDVLITKTGAKNLSSKAPY